MKEETHDINEIIIRYLDGSAELEEKRLLLRWLKQSDDNRDDFIATRDLWLSCNVAAGNELETDGEGLACEEKYIIGGFALDAGCCRLVAFAGNRLWYRQLEGAFRSCCHRAKPTDNGKRKQRSVHVA